MRVKSCAKPCFKVTCQIDILNILKSISSFSKKGGRMDRITRLVENFIFISDFVKFYFKKYPEQKNFSPNQNYFYEEEVITVYLFGIDLGLRTVKEIHSYIAAQKTFISMAQSSIWPL